MFQCLRSILSTWRVLLFFFKQYIMHSGNFKRKRINTTWQPKKQESPNFLPPLSIPLGSVWNRFHPYSLPLPPHNSSPLLIPPKPSVLSFLSLWDPRQIWYMIGAHIFSEHGLLTAQCGGFLQTNVHMRSPATSTHGPGTRNSPWQHRSSSLSVSLTSEPLGDQVQRSFLLWLPAKPKFSPPPASAVLPLP